MCAIVCASKAVGNSPYEKVKILCKMPTKLFLRPLHTPKTHM